METIKEINTSKVVHYIKNDVLHIVFKNDVIVDLDDMIESKKVREELQKGNPMKVFVDARGLFQITKDAREFASLEENAKMSSKMAIVVNSLGIRMVANFFVKVNKPNTPSKMFSTKEKALEWLDA